MGGGGSTALIAALGPWHALSILVPGALQSLLPCVATLRGAVSDAVIFAAIFVGFFILRGIAATVFFYYILPQGDRCPNCDAVTLRVQSRGWRLVMPHVRPSWCYECNWHGLLREGPLTPVATSPALTKQP